ncbi:hypothetical protein NDA12_000117 [Ustilago hordei]|nr:hypothetical protein NDA15_007025 [Ustilago hordei]KAJ1579505.1 hypothetical protein NDA12_000117 [Ustilago hordei]
MQQGNSFGSGGGSAFGSNPGFGTNSGPGPNAPKVPSGFDAFARPQTPTSLSSSSGSAPPNTFSSSTPQNPSSSAFWSGPNKSQQQSSFGRSRPHAGRPRPPSQSSNFNASSPFSGTQQQQQQQSHQQRTQEQQQPTFGNRPRPFTSRSSGSGAEGRPPLSTSFRGGRGGGGTIRPIRPFASHADTNQQTQADPSNMQAPRPRPRPFANKSTTFNNMQSTPTSSSSAAQSGAQASVSSSAFGVSTSAQNGTSAFPTFGTASSSNHASSSSLSQQSSSSAQNTSAFGSSATSDKPASFTSFGSVTMPGSVPASGLNTTTSFGTSASTPSSSAFGGSSNGSSLGSAFSSFQPQTRPQAPAAKASSNQPATAPAAPAASAASAAPTSSFSNFLRKDRTGTSTPVEASDATKGMEDEDELRKKRFEDAPKQGNRFLEMKGGREALRNAYIKSGVLPDPDKPTDLALAVKLVGTCQDMCPEFEREEREFQKELDPLEVYPGTDRVDPRIAVKIYRRPAAGRELPLPEDVRPPPVLKRTLDYLFHDLLPADPNDSRFTSVQGFLWNRTRAVRQDFIVQSEGGAIAIECHERIARYHILCLHWRGGPGAEGWSEQQELEQLRKTMRSLIEFYDDNRRKASAGSTGNVGHQTSPNEAEFRAYNLLLHLRDPETLREAELLPGDIFRSPLVQTAINLRQLAQRSNNLEKRGQPKNTEATLNFFSKFFAELRKPNVNYLMACLAENSFSSIRIGAIKAMSKAYMAQHRALPIERVQHVLGMDSAEQVVAMTKHLGIELEYESGTLFGVKIHRNTTIKEDKPLVTPFSTTIVEAKRGSYTSADVVDGRASGVSAPLPSTAISLGRPAAAAPSSQSFAKSTSAGGPSSFGFGTQQSSALSSGMGASNAFGQQQAKQDTSQATAFGSASPSKLSASASTFTPTAYGGAAHNSSSFSTSLNTFGGFLDSTSASKEGATTTKPALPSFGAFGKESQTKQEPGATATSPFGSKASVPSPQSSEAQKRSSMSSFSFGGSGAKSPFATSDTDSKQGSEQQSAAPSFTFDAAAKMGSQQSKPSSSFFSSSAGAKEPAQNKTESKLPSFAPIRAADAKQDNASSAPTSQKRRASHADENASVQAAAAAKADAEAEAQAKRKEASRDYAVKRAFTALSNEVVHSAAAKAAASAVQAEEERRRAASRDQLVTRLTDRLWQELADEHVLEAAKETSRIAAADVFRSRSCAMRAWSRWTQALEERRDREQQRQRLEAIRSEIRRRNILGRIQANEVEGVSSTLDSKAVGKHSQDQTSLIQHAFSIRQSLLTGERASVTNQKLNTAARLKRKLEDETVSETQRRGDDALTEGWTRVRRQRNQLWAEGSLLEKLADHIEELLLHFRPADLNRLVVLYCGAPGQHVASSWLRVKFGFKPSAPSDGNEEESDRDVLEVDLADGSQLELADITPSSDGNDIAPESVLQADEHSQPGLVIFETNPAAAQAKPVVERRNALVSDRKRLEMISSFKLIRGSHLACRLLVVTWGDSSTDGTDDVEMTDADADVAANAKQKSLLNHLGLDPSKPNSVFERIGILQLDDASVSVEDMLAALLQRVLPDVTANPYLHLNGSHRATLEDVVQDFCDQWGHLSALLFDLLSGLPGPVVSGSEVAGSKTEALACKALQILTALANHILRTVLSLSETVHENDKPAEERKIELPLPSPVKSGLVGMALSQIDELTEEEQKLHLRSQLLSSLQAKGPHETELQLTLAVVNRQYIEQLFRLSLSKLNEAWFGVRQDTEAEWTQAKEVFGRLCSAAVEEVATETRAIWAEYRAQADGGMEMDKGSGSPSKKIRTGSNASQESTLPTSEPAKASKVNDLRDLIARTRRFLDSPAS